VYVSLKRFTERKKTKEYLQQYRFILLFLLLEKDVQKKVITEIWEKQPGKRPLERMVRPAQRGLKSKRGPSSSSPLRDTLLAKWLSFADESLKFKKSNLHGTS
jgi:hypothetical protein